MTEFYDKIHFVDTMEDLIEYLKDFDIDLTNINKEKFYNLLPELGIAVYDFINDFIDDMWDEFEQMMADVCDNLDDIIGYIDIGSWIHDLLYNNELYLFKVNNVDKFVAFWEWKIDDIREELKKE